MTLQRNIKRRGGGAGEERCRSGRLQISFRSISFVLQQFCPFSLPLRWEGENNREGERKDRFNVVAFRVFSNIAKLCAQQPAAEQCRSSIVYNGVECWSFKKIENKNYKKTKIIKKQAQKSHSQLKST